MSVKILCISSSPRRHGNSETLLDWFIDAVSKHESAECGKVVLSDYDIKPCRGCNACEKTGKCLIKDDTAGIIERVLAADVVVFAAPIYCVGVCAQAKAFIDRIQVLRSRKDVLNQETVEAERKGKRIGVFISTAGQPDEGMFKPAVAVMKCFFHHCGIGNKNIEYLLVGGADGKGAVKKTAGAKEDAQALADGVMAKITAMIN
ncbi:MAG: flavodoxin family protein [Methanomicrobium sp.]|nr:flavodoxin family protein [Methanomicrobium sp.]